MKPAGYVYMLCAVKSYEWKDTRSYNLAAKNGISERKIIRQLLL
jgi:hypothetical protein